MKARSLRDDDGTLLPLMIFFGFFCLILVLLVVAATSLYLERARLFTLADGAALVGAEAFDLGDTTDPAGARRPVLAPAEVDGAVREYLAAVPTGGFESLVLETATTADGRSATVELSSYWRPPIVSLLLPEGIRLDVRAVARSVFS